MAQLFCSWQLNFINVLINICPRQVMRYVVQQNSLKKVHLNFKWKHIRRVGAEGFNIRQLRTNKLNRNGSYVILDKTKLNTSQHFNPLDCRLCRIICIHFQMLIDFFADLNLLFNVVLPNIFVKTIPVQYICSQLSDVESLHTDFSNMLPFKLQVDLFQQILLHNVAHDSRHITRTDPIM